MEIKKSTTLQLIIIALSLGSGILLMLGTNNYCRLAISNECKLQTEAFQESVYSTPINLRGSVDPPFPCIYEQPKQCGFPFPVTESMTKNGFSHFDLNIKNASMNYVIWSTASYVVLLLASFLIRKKKPISPTV